MAPIESLGKSTKPVVDNRNRMHFDGDTPQKLWGILKQKERWCLSLRGWLLVVSVALIAAYWLVSNVHPFLAVTDRVDTDVLVVEGWMQRYALIAATEEFKKGAYQRVLTTGGPENG